MSQPTKPAKRKSMKTHNEIKTLVANFLDGRGACYAIPGTEVHTSNFYGDTHICEFTADQLAGVIEMAQENWFKTAEDTQGERYTITEAAEMIFGDMQFTRPDALRAASQPDRYAKELLQEMQEEDTLVHLTDAAFLKLKALEGYEEERPEDV